MGGYISFLDPSHLLRSFSFFKKMYNSFLDPSYLDPSHFQKWTFPSYKKLRAFLFSKQYIFPILDPSHFSKMYITSLLYLTKNVSPRQKHVTKAKMRVLEEFFICRMPIGRCIVYKQQFPS